MSGRYARDTTVSVERSKAQIESLLARYGASGYATGWDGARAMVGFTMHHRQVRFVLALPDPADSEFTQTATGRDRSDAAARKAWEQACRSRWRALLLSIQAKLESIEVGIATFDEEFLAHIVLPDGSTAGQHALPAVATAYESGRVTPLLPGGE